MGNCIVHQGKPVRVMKTDGKIIEYKAPIKVHQVLSEFSHHALSDNQLPLGKHLHPNTEMLQGRLYYLLPLPWTPMKKKKNSNKVVRFSDDVVEMEEPGKVVRIKLVISKKELQEMLGSEGIISDGDVVSQVQTGPAAYKIQSISRDGGISPRGCLPGALETIPESN
ncbi:uncharacterized protein LOC127252039 [Andrographis paniculata]|uniref:uncharacterized protein LOC127252039 n=1 Tax=Andrographis paniculata TaxID=175694 RepID=UPI0021E8E17E|nr:uncharacterized protein LOC127252039 [Andrographis paniculata]